MFCVGILIEAKLEYDTRYGYGYVDRIGKSEVGTGVESMYERLSTDKMIYLPQKCATFLHFSSSIAIKRERCRTGEKSS